jgi:enoyl-[acyl-carrier protein] reductase I
MQTFQQTGYWAVILGGSSGIGLAAAHKLAAEGMHLCIVHRDRRQRLPELEKEWACLRAAGVELLTFNRDALRQEKQEEILDELATALGQEGRVRLFLHSISRGNLKRLSPATLQAADPLAQPDDFSLTFEAMALSYYHWVKALFSRRLFAQDARCIGLTSEGSYRAWPHYAQVGASKAALEAISRSIAAEFGYYGIRSNLIQAGITPTPSLALIPDQETLKAQSLGRNPMRRLTRPEDVADVIYLLCRDEAAWINGAILPVDGGEKNV